MHGQVVDGLVASSEVAEVSPALNLLTLMPSLRFAVLSAHLHTLLEREAQIQSGVNFKAEMT